MRKYFFGFLAFLSLSAIATAPRAQYSTTLVGLRLGTTFAGQTSDFATPGTTSGLKFGILGGAQIEHWFDEHWGVGIGILFDQKGAHENYSEGSITNIDTGNNRNIAYSGDDDFTLSYLEIPIHLKVAFGYGDVKPYVFVGPSIGLLLSASDKTTNNIPGATDLKTYLNSVDVAIDFGLGFMDKFYNGPTFFFDAGYSIGLSKIYKSDPPRTVPAPNIFPSPISHLTAKSADIRIGLGAMWPM